MWHLKKEFLLNFTTVIPQRYCQVKYHKIRLVVVVTAIGAYGWSERLRAAGRLGVTIIWRHTALGDAVATAEIFLRLIPLLAARGLVTLEEARKASRRTHEARLRY